MLLALSSCAMTSSSVAPAEIGDAASVSSRGREPLLVLQRNEWAWTLDAAGAIGDIGGVDAQDIDADGRIVALRPDQIWYTPPGYNGSISFYRRDAVVVIDTETGVSEVLAEAAPNETFGGPARWSPDGRTIALWVLTYPAALADAHPGANAGDPAVCLLSVEGGSRPCFPQAGRSVSLDWSPDGNRLLVAGLGGPVSVLDLRTGALTPIVDASGGADAAALLHDRDLGHVIALQSAAWSRTGRYVAVHAAVVPGGSTMIVYSAQGEALAIGAISDDAEPFAWSPTDDVLAYAAADTSSTTRGSTLVHVWNPSSGDARVANLAASGDWGINGITWSPDGETLALNTSEHPWLLERLDATPALRKLNAPGAVVAWG
jgi:WD40 repeat protein